MSKWLFWLYFCNAVVLINHEIESAFWKEWELFKLPGGVSGFVLLHFPLLAAILYGMILLERGNPLGWLFSLGLGLGGVFAFCIHTYFLKKGRTEFNTLLSKSVLAVTLVISIVQLAVTVLVMSGSNTAIV